MAHHGPGATPRDASADHRTAAYCPLTAAGRGLRHDAAARQRLAGAALAAAGEA